MELKFVKASKEQDFKNIFDYNIDAFSDSPDFKWTLDEIKHEVKEGWQLFAAYLNSEIIAACFLRVDNKKLLTKNTAIKMTSQGSGYSHQIKEFFEEQAKELKTAQVIHYCRIDNFRMYSLNESHGYKKTDRKLGERGLIVEWVKSI
ncbi:MAG: hypothetical protein KAG61_14095 [Bacteriovoracaceae bacterium]|nr:hypothetical protein [Bacteriovoracaceae bacterium]